MASNKLIPSAILQFLKKKETASRSYLSGKFKNNVIFTLKY